MVKECSLQGGKVNCPFKSEQLRQLLFLKGFWRVASVIFSSGYPTINIRSKARGVWGKRNLWGENRCHYHRDHHHLRLYIAAPRLSVDRRLILITKSQWSIQRSSSWATNYIFVILIIIIFVTEIIISIFLVIIVWHQERSKEVREERRLLRVGSLLWRSVSATYIKLEQIA